MKQTLLTLGLATFFIILAMVGLSIGYIITGKSKLHKKCGYTPKKNKDATCGKDPDCPVCGNSAQKNSNSSK